MTRSAAILAAVLVTGRVFAAEAVAPEAAGGAMDFVRLPLSVNQAASPGNWADYDVLKVFGNPAFLSYQPRSAAVGVSTQVRNDGDQNLTAIGAGWAGKPSDSGTFGFAVMGATWGMRKFDEIDIFAVETGTTVAPVGWMAGAAGMFQWKFVSLGAGYRMAGEEYGVAGIGESTGGMLDAGTAMTLGPLVFAAGYRGLDSSSFVNVGAGIRFKGRFKGSASAEWNIPMDSSVLSYGGGGITWFPVPAFGFTVGLQLRGAGSAILFGITAPVSNFMFDYAAQAGPGGMGVSHHLGAGWMNGRERTAPESAATIPRLFTGEKESTIAVPNFEAQNTAAGDAAVITDLLRSEIVKQGAFNVVDKTNMERVLNEQAFQQTGCTSAECAVKLGKILNVRYLVVGTFGKVLGRYVLSMRVVEVETARIIYTDEVEAADLSELRAGIKSMASRLTEAVGKK